MGVHENNPWFAENSKARNQGERQPQYATEM
jgi:hypothetical protein